MILWRVGVETLGMGARVGLERGLEGGWLPGGRLPGGWLLRG